MDFKSRVKAIREESGGSSSSSGVGISAAAGT